MKGDDSIMAKRLHLRGIDAVVLQSTNAACALMGVQGLIT